MLTISRQTLLRLPQYLNYLKTLPSGTEYISATSLAQALSLGDVQVRKDLAAVSDRGRPKVGYETSGLIYDIESFLGYDNADSAVLVGAGNLGRALLSYEGFSTYGLDIVAGFDADRSKQGVTENGKRIFPLSRLGELCQRVKIKLGIIAVPAAAAQSVCDTMIAAGVLAIWNFAPVHLTVPEGILVHNENMAVSLAVLSKHLADKLREGT
ncbi:Redox-sensing transcriptional repressor rex [uncultured Eubacteriales bacterium]|uniref:Redox-sensing transcriptional repressor Rex n=1 Tax=uncultured Eubacteriales bacterium TaxID=172733 RepID=A0A212KB56_9FIRM|nr:Redox-sensing transcriptional repressor rex [uncultured Eubacteriales bacterium]